MKGMYFTDFILLNRCIWYCRESAAMQDCPSLLLLPGNPWIDAYPAPVLPSAPASHLPWLWLHSPEPCSVRGWM